GIFACFSENSVNRSFADPEKRQPPSPETARTAGGSDRPGAIKAPGLSPAILSVLRKTPGRGESFSKERGTAAQIWPIPVGRGRDSAPPSRRPHSGPQAVTRGFPAPAGASPHADARQCFQACPAAVDRTHPLPVG